MRRRQLVVSDLDGTLRGGGVARTRFAKWYEQAASRVALVCWQVFDRERHARTESYGPIRFHDRGALMQSRAELLRKLVQRATLLRGGSHTIFVCRSTTRKRTISGLSEVANKDCHRSFRISPPLQEMTLMPTSLWIALAVFGACILFALWFGQDRIKVGLDQTKQGKTGKHTTIGRFQVATAASTSSAANPLPLIVVCDTATGQCWTCDADSGDWRDLHSPFVATIVTEVDTPTVHVHPPHSALSERKNA